MWQSGSKKNKYKAWQDYLFQGHHLCYEDYSRADGTILAILKRSIFQRIQHYLQNVKFCLSTVSKLKIICENFEYCVIIISIFTSLRPSIVYRFRVTANYAVSHTSAPWLHANHYVLHLAMITHCVQGHSPVFIYSKNTNSNGERRKEEQELART